mgnify:CR=1 FL=1
MQINFFGDFVAPSVTHLSLSKDLEKLIGKGDVNVVNCEAVSIDNATGKYGKIAKSGPNLSQDVNTPQWLEAHGFSVVSLANNHIFDYGEDALLATMHAFGEADVVGSGKWSEAYRPCIVNVQGKKIGFIALTHCEFGTLTDKWEKKDESIGAAWINHPCVDKIVLGTRPCVDYLFIFAHAGVEHVNQPLPEWRDRYRSFIDMGCDGVIASHPHVIQGWETYKGKPIVYSLGNFYFPKKDQNAANWFRSICASIRIEGKGSIELNCTPLRFEPDNVYIDDTDKAQDYLQKVNRILNDELLYMDFINNTCRVRLEIYYAMLLNGGMARCHNMKKILRLLHDYAFKGLNFDSTWFYNFFRCESHRWCFERGMKLQCGYK